MIRPQSKDVQANSYMDYLEKRLQQYESSPHLRTYLTLVKQVDNFNKQLTEANIDLFADKDDKGFDRGWKYMLEAETMLTQLEKIRLKMTDSEKSEANQKIVKKEGVEEYLRTAKDATTK